jgi:hypothetical protein
MNGEVNFRRVRETHHHRPSTVRSTHPTDFGRGDAESKNSQPLRLVMMGKVGMILTG